MTSTNDCKITWTATGGAFLCLDVAGARALIDKVASNQSWKEDRQPAHEKGIHEIDSVNMLAAKMDLLMEKLESPHQEVNQTMESQMTCEKCGNCILQHSHHCDGQSYHPPHASAKEPRDITHNSAHL